MKSNRCNLLLLLLLSVSSSCLGMASLVIGGKIFIEVENQADYKISIFRFPLIKGRDLIFDLLPGETASEYSLSTGWVISKPLFMQNSLTLWPEIERGSNKVIVHLDNLITSPYRKVKLFKKELELDPKNPLIINLQVNKELEKSIVTINKVLTLKELAIRQIAEDIKAKSNTIDKKNILSPLPTEMKEAVEDYLATHQ